MEQDIVHEATLEPTIEGTEACDAILARGLHFYLMALIVAQRLSQDPSREELQQVITTHLDSLWAEHQKAQQAVQEEPCHAE